jgi:hypothetical protein
MGDRTMRHKRLSDETRRRRERISDRTNDRAVREAEAAHRIAVSLRPLTPVKRARVLRAAAALAGVIV